MPGRCQVDFYVLQDAELSAKHLACRLALRAWEQGHRVAVITEDESQAKMVDELMWEHPPGRFLPHSRGAADSMAPVQIGTATDAIGSDRDLIINLTALEFPEPERFSRLLEIVPAQDAERAASRDKFKAYRGRGLTPITHKIGKSK
jgi:DNA polymerase-3 subunit chi